MVYCQKCGSENVDDAKFCVNCGAEIKRVKKEERKQQLQDDTPEVPKTPKPSKPSPKPSPLSTTLMVVLIVVAAIIGFSIGILVANPFGGDEEKNNIPTGDNITLSVQEFHDAVEYNIDDENYTVYNNIRGVENGDILKITGKIVQIVGNYNEDIGEYTSVALYYSNESNLLVHVFGNISNKYNIGDYVSVTLHMTECYGSYEDLWGNTWLLSGDFMEETFVDGKFALDLIVPQAQIKEI